MDTISSYFIKPSNCPVDGAACVRFEKNSPRFQEAQRQYRKPAPRRDDVVLHVLDTMEGLGINPLHYVIDTEQLSADEYGYLIFDRTAVLDEDSAAHSFLNLTFVEDGNDVYPLCLSLGVNDLNIIYPNSVDDYTKTYWYKNRYTGKMDKEWSFPTKGIIAHQLGLKFSKTIDLFPLDIENNVLTGRQVEQIIGESIASKYPLLDRYSHCYPL